MKVSHYYQRLSHAILLTTTLTAAPAFAEYSYASKIQPSLHHSQHVTSYESSYSQGQLAQILAPIALYPDVLLSHTLIASTYPSDIAEAAHWLTRHHHLNTHHKKQKIKHKPWDESVKALIQFPSIIHQLSYDSHWAESLSIAFLDDEERVLNSIQLLRKKADKAGSLSQLNYLRVERHYGIIAISIPSSNQVRLPFYDPRKVYGKWHWRNYQPVRFHKTKRFSRHKGPFYWSEKKYIGGHAFFSAFNWLNHHVVIYHDRRSFKHHRGYHHKKSYHNSHHWKKNRSFKNTAFKKQIRHIRDGERQHYQQAYHQQNRHSVYQRRSHEQKQYNHRNATIKKSPKLIKKEHVKYKDKQQRFKRQQDSRQLNHHQRWTKNM